MKPIPRNINKTAAAFPNPVVGETSPYPTVVAVVIDHHNAVPNDTFSEMQYSEEAIRITVKLMYK